MTRETSRRHKKRSYWRCPECRQLVPRQQWSCECGVQKSERVRFQYQEKDSSLRELWLGGVVLLLMAVLALSLLRGCAPAPPTSAARYSPTARAQKKR